MSRLYAVQQAMRASSSSEVCWSASGEHCDGRISAAMKAGAPMTDEVGAMIARPVAK